MKRETTARQIVPGGGNVTACMWDHVASYTFVPRNKRCDLKCKRVGPPFLLVTMGFIS